MELARNQGKNVIEALDERLAETQRFRQEQADFMAMVEAHQAEERKESQALLMEVMRLQNADLRDERDSLRTQVAILSQVIADYQRKVGDLTARLEKSRQTQNSRFPFFPQPQI